VTDRVTSHASPPASNAASSATITISRVSADALSAAAATFAPVWAATAFCTPSNASSTFGISGTTCSTYGTREPSRSSTPSTVSWRDVLIVRDTRVCSRPFIATARSTACRPAGVCTRVPSAPRSVLTSASSRSTSLAIRSWSPSIPS
jgi:hypothetical protein